MKKTTKDDYINQISDIFYEAIEKNIAPWTKNWKAEDFRYSSHNPISKSSYKGNNSLLLDTVRITKNYNSNAWLTYNQAKELGGNIVKGSKATPVVFYSKIKNDNVEKENEKEYKFILKKYSVFNLEQVEGLSEETLTKLKLDEKELEKKDFLSLDECERILKSVDVKIKHFTQDRAFYSPSIDEIHLPLKEQFTSPQAYYSTAFHELGHSTGHSSRLNRDLSGKFGSESYAKEELRAEIYSFLQARELGIDYNLENHQSYVKSWTKNLKEKKEEIYEAVKDSLKMTEFVRERYIIQAQQQMQEVEKEENKDNSLINKVKEYVKDEVKDNIKDNAKDNISDKIEESLGMNPLDELSKNLIVVFGLKEFAEDAEKIKKEAIKTLVS